MANSKAAVRNTTPRQELAAAEAEHQAAQGDWHKALDVVDSARKRRDAAATRLVKAQESCVAAS